MRAVAQSLLYDGSLYECASVLLAVFAGVGDPAFDVVLSLDGLLLDFLCLGDAVEVCENGDEVVFTDSDECVLVALGAEVVDALDGRRLVAVASDDYVVAFLERLRCRRFGFLLLLRGLDDGGDSLGCVGRRDRSRDGNLDRRFLGEEELLSGSVDGVVLVDDEEEEPEEDDEEQDDEAYDDAFFAAVAVGHRIIFLLWGWFRGRGGSWDRRWLLRLWFWLGSCGLRLLLMGGERRSGIVLLRELNASVGVAMKAAYAADGDRAPVLESVVVVVDGLADFLFGLIFCDPLAFLDGGGQFPVVEVEVGVEREEDGFLAQGLDATEPWNYYSRFCGEKLLDIFIHISFSMLAITPAFWSLCGLGQ